MTEAAEDRSWLWKFLALAAALHLIAAIFSQGFFHSDEHFQILEFANYLIGGTPRYDLPIEFRMMIRPWLEPGIFAVLMGIGRYLGIWNPFTWAFVFRLISASLGWLALAQLARCCRIWFPVLSRRRAAIAALCLIWYMPAFHARVSSENWGGIFVILGLTAYLLAPKHGIGRCFGIGLCFGAAFEFRYQTGVMVVGALAWMLWEGKARARELVAIGAGIAVVVAIGTVLDRLAYGTWTCAPWNYVRYNLIQGHVGDVDSDPPWDLFRRAFTEAWPLLGFLLLCSQCVAWVRHRRHPLTWTSVPLFVTHAIIGHKELRFLFPLLHAAPVMLVQSIEGIRGRPWMRTLAGALVGWNAIGLAALSLIPAWMPIRLQSYLYHHAPPSPVPGQRAVAEVVEWKDKSPYRWNGIAMDFYKPEGVRLHELTSYAELLAPGPPRLLFYDGFRLKGEAAPLEAHCEARFHALPAWIESFAASIRVERLLDHVSNWSLYECRP